MTNEEAINILRHCGAEPYCFDYKHGTCNQRIAQNMAIEALKRAERMKRYRIDIPDSVIEEAQKITVKKIETVFGNPMKELITCKDCKHRDPEDGKCDSGHFIQWQLPREDDWFCADGERKEA